MDNLSEKLIESILKEDDPVLFLGAGFSLGANNISGKIPSGNDLKEILLKDLLYLNENSPDYKELIEAPLAAISEYCKREKSIAHYNDFISKLFTGCRPSLHHRLLTSYGWKKIYTTNIDDIVERVYADARVELVVQNKPRKSTIPIRPESMEYLKIHGDVNNSSEGFVFSTSDYTKTLVRIRDYRLDSLATDMHYETIIFLGTNFSEADIDYYIELYKTSGLQSVRGKLVFVNPKISIIAKSKIKEVGGKIIQSNAEEFLQKVKEIADSIVRKKGSKGDFGLKKSGFIRIAKPKDYKTLKTYKSKLYFGYHPTWYDVWSDWDFEDERIYKGLNDFIVGLGNDKSGIFAVVSKPYSGKSVFLKRIAIKLYEDGYESFYFRGRNFDSRPLLNFIKSKKHFKKVAIIFDDASYNYHLIKSIYDKLKRYMQVLLVTSSRTYYHERNRLQLHGAIVKEFQLDTKINRDYSIEIIGKLRDKGYLGNLKKLAKGSEMQEYVSAHSDVMTLLFEITLGKGFKGRMMKDLAPIIYGDSFSQEMLLNLVIFEKMDLPYFPMDLVSKIYPSNTEIIIRSIEGFVKANQFGELQLRNNFIVNPVWKSATKNQVLTQIKDILIAIYTYVDNESSSYWNEIHAALNRTQLLNSRLKIPFSDSKSILYELRSYYEDNYNYWLQLGLAEQRIGEYEAALNHLNQAKAIRPTSFMVLNSIGRNFLKQGNAAKIKEEAEGFIIEGQRILTDVIQNYEMHAKAFAVHIYILEKVKYFKKFSVQPSNNEIKRLTGYLDILTRVEVKDDMINHVISTFVNYLNSIGKGGFYKMNFTELAKLKAVVDNQTDVELEDDMF